MVTLLVLEELRAPQNNSSLEHVWFHAWICDHATNHEVLEEPWSHNTGGLLGKDATFLLLAAAQKILVVVPRGRRSRRQRQRACKHTINIQQSSRAPRRTLRGAAQGAAAERRRSCTKFQMINHIQLHFSILTGRRTRIPINGKSFKAKLKFLAFIYLATDNSIEISSVSLQWTPLCLIIQWSGRIQFQLPLCVHGREMGRGVDGG